jgi:hypothetical protein
LFSIQAKISVDTFESECRFKGNTKTTVIMKTKGILIDPAIRSIQPIIFDGDWEAAISDIVGSKKIAKIVVDDRNAMYLDAEPLSDSDKFIERMTENPENIWFWLGQDKPFVGKGFLLGYSEDSDAPTNTSFVPSRVTEYASPAQLGKIVELDSE